MAQGAGQALQEAATSSGVSLPRLSDAELQAMLPDEGYTVLMQPAVSSAAAAAGAGAGGGSEASTSEVAAAQVMASVS